jgi:hypothetical protein
MGFTKGSAMKCSSCGKQIIDEAIFCPQCGDCLLPSEAQPLSSNQSGGIDIDADGDAIIGHDVVGRDKVEIHAQYVSWNGHEVVDPNENWIRDGLTWIQVKYSRQQHLLDEIASLDEATFYHQGRILFEQREYDLSALHWEELRKRVPHNTEYESYLRLCLSKVRREINFEQTKYDIYSRLQSAMATMAIRGQNIDLVNEAIGLLEMLIVLSPDDFQAKESLRKYKDLKLQL